MMFFLDKVNDMIYLKDESLKYIYANEAHEDVLGIEVSLILGRRDGDIMPLKEAEHCIKSDLIALEEGIYSREEPLGDKWYHVVKHRVELSDEGFVGVMGVIRDITKQKVLISKLNEATYKDFLTGLYNRRYYNKVSNKLFKRSREDNESLSLILLDIDNFKRINDTFGHLEGDRVLKKLSRIINRSIGGGDLPFRIGGEEFLVLLPKKDLVMAQGLAMKIKEELRKDNFFIKGEPVDLTFSAGIAQIGIEDQEVEETFRRADAKLYEGKKTGKDKIII